MKIKKKNLLTESIWIIRGQGYFQSPQRWIVGNRKGKEVWQHDFVYQALVSLGKWETVLSLACVWSQTLGWEITFRVSPSLLALAELYKKNFASFLNINWGNHSHFRMHLFIFYIIFLASGLHFWMQFLSKGDIRVIKSMESCLVF